MSTLGTTNIKQLSEKEFTDIHNLVLKSDGSVGKLYGYRTLKGMIWLLKRANKNAVKYKVRLRFTIELPIKEK